MFITEHANISFSSSCIIYDEIFLHYQFALWCLDHSLLWCRWHVGMLLQCQIMQ